MWYLSHFCNESIVGEETRTRIKKRKINHSQRGRKYRRYLHTFMAIKNLSLHSTLKKKDETPRPFPLAIAEALKSWNI
jgi:hypothetical protein